jgi:hypothetical protein
MYLHMANVEPWAVWSVEPRRAAVAKNQESPSDHCCCLRYYVTLLRFDLIKADQSCLGNKGIEDALFFCQQVLWGIQLRNLLEGVDVNMKG